MCIRDSFNGREQTEEERKEGAKLSLSLFKIGFNRAVKRAGISNSIKKDMKLSLKDSFLILPQVLTMLSAIGVSALILAEYTPLFQWLGNIFKPLLMLCQVPDINLIAPSIPVGIAEMFLPVLVMGTKISIISEPARVFVTLVSIVQIIFFSETATVMLATKSPIKFWEIIVCFLERTVIAIPLAALVIHFLF